MRDSISASETLIFGDIPRIDMAVWDRASTVSERLAIAAEVRAICHEIGFFYLVNQGVISWLLNLF